MVVLSNSDMFEVRISSLLADYDRDTLTNLYQPLIGYSALAIFFTLWSEANNQKVLSYSTHEQLLARMQMPAGHFVEARKLLEAVGLVKTRLEKHSGASIYHYELCAPKTPKEYFKDTLLYGMLIQNLGDIDANRLKSVYEYSLIDNEGEDISSSFNDVFHPDFNNDAYLKAAKIGNGNTIGRNKSKIATAFNYEIFFAELKKDGAIKETSLTKKELKEINRLAALYGLDESQMAYLVNNSYEPENEKGSRVDFTRLKDSLITEANYALINKKEKLTINGTLNSDTLNARRINLYENTAPAKFLSYLQGGTKVAASDLKILDSLSKEFMLNTGVINTLVSFVLTMNKNILSRSYAEKIAASFNRENIKTTIDAMNFCNEYINKISSKETGKKVSKKDNKSTNSRSEKNDIISKQEWDALFEKSGEEDEKNDSELPF